MKQKFLLSLVFACTLAISTKAQISKGATWLGGSIWYNQQKEDYETSPQDNKYSTLSITPAVGKVVKDNLVVGVGITYVKTKTDNNYTSVQEQDDEYIGGSFFVRRYVPVISRLYVFGEASATFRDFKGKAAHIDYSTGALYEVKTNTKGWEGGLGFTPGVAFNLTKNFQLETGFNNLLGVSYSKRNTTSLVRSYEKESSSFSGSLNLDPKNTFFLGFRFLLNNKG